MTKIINLIKKHKIIFGILILVIVSLVYWRLTASSNQTGTVQTTRVTKGNITASISASGQVTNTSSSPVETKTSGVVAKVNVENGATVKKGDVIMEITPDQDSQQKKAAAWASYLQAKNSLNSANSNYYTLRQQLFAANQKFMNDAVVRELKTDDATYMQQNDAWLAAEANFKNQTDTVTQVKASLNNAWLSYQQVSGIVTAPISGVVSNMSLQPGSIVVLDSSANTNTTPSSQVALIKNDIPPMVSINLAEIDVVKVKIGDKTEVVFDALPDKTYSGKLLAIDTGGVVSSGVTSYPATISLDETDIPVLPNMSATADIVTAEKENVLLIPSAAIINQNGQSMVRVQNNGQIEFVPVETGLASDTQTEIVSGLNEGDLIVVGTTSNSSSSSTGTSPFSSLGGGGAIRVR